MKLVSEVLQEVVNTCVSAQVRNRGEVFGKAVEEIGELSTAIFIPEKVSESAFFESCDLTIAAIDNCFMNFLQERYECYNTRDLVGMSEEDLERLGQEFQEALASALSSKLNKWKGLIQRRKNS